MKLFLQADCLSCAVGTGDLAVEKTYNPSFVGFTGLVGCHYSHITEVEITVNYINLKCTVG